MSETIGRGLLGAEYAYLNTGSVGGNAAVVVGLVGGGGGGWGEREWAGDEKKPERWRQPRYAEWRASLVAQPPDKEASAIV